MAKRETTTEMTDPKAMSASIALNIKLRKNNFRVLVTPETSIRDLKFILQPLTKLPPNGQKLFFKGTTLKEEMTVSSSNIMNGAKIMVVNMPDGPTVRETQPMTDKEPDTTEVYVDINQRLKNWKVTGVVALAECNLESIPDEVWACGSIVRFLDVNGNSILEIPAQIGCLSSLQTFFLNANGLSEGTISWEGLTSLKHLIILSASQNFFTTLPPELGALTFLRKLDVSNNQLTALPDNIGLLVRLEVLKVDNNRISTIPDSIGNCKALTEVNFSSNLLTVLPDTFVNLQKLKTLRLSKNKLKSLPLTLFKICINLLEVDISDTEIFCSSYDTLRQMEGWEDFYKRRDLNIQKRLDFQVLGPGIEKNVEYI